MRYLHTMVRVSNVEESLDFFADKLGLKEVRRTESQQGRFTLIFLAADENPDAQVELTYNWDPEVYTGGRNFGHLAYSVADIYATCQRADGQGRDHQSPAARRPHGVRQIARRHLDRASAAGRGAAAERALDLDAERRQLVTLPPPPADPGPGHKSIAAAACSEVQLTHYTSEGFRSGPSGAHFLGNATALSALRQYGHRAGCLGRIGHRRGDLADSARCLAAARISWPAPSHRLCWRRLCPGCWLKCTGAC